MNQISKIKIMSQKGEVLQICQIQCSEIKVFYSMGFVFSFLSLLWFVSFVQDDIAQQNLYMLGVWGWGWLYLVFHQYYISRKK